MNKWHTDMQCEWGGDHEIYKDIVFLRFEPMNFCDMGGAIETAKKLCPHVRQIITIVGSEPDTLYIEMDGEFVAKDLRGFRGKERYSGPSSMRVQ